VKVIRGVEQGSADWLALRAGRVTASNFGKVLAGGQGKTRRAYMLQLVAERLTGEPAETYTNAAMEWGTQTEPQARAVYELMTGREVEEVTITLEGDYIAASPDGLVGHRDEYPSFGGLEIKCPNTSTHLDYLLRGELPAQYRPQVQGCIWVHRAPWWDFMSFDPRLPPASQAFILRVERDEEYIESLAGSVRAFVREMLELEQRLRGEAE